MMGGRGVSQIRHNRAHIPPGGIWIRLDTSMGIALARRTFSATRSPWGSSLTRINPLSNALAEVASGPLGMRNTSLWLWLLVVAELFGASLVKAQITPIPPPAIQPRDKVTPAP